MSTENGATPVILGRYAGFFSRGAAFAIDQAITFGIKRVQRFQDRRSKS